MKHTFLILILVGSVLQGCIGFGGDDDFVEPQRFIPTNNYEPVFFPKSELDNSILLTDSQNITNSGKIYVVDNLLFVSEKQRGFHVFDNSNPTNPQQVKFIRILGSTDLAVRNNILYVNQATDLITLQYDYNTDNLVLLKRVKNAFPSLRSPNGQNAPEYQDSVVIAWKLKN